MQLKKSVAIIGGGPSAAPCIKALLAENYFGKITAYELQPAPGAGVWNYNGLTRPTPYIPCTSDTPSEPLEHKADGSVVFYNPMYRDLNTNLPHMLMAYKDFPFPEGVDLFPRREVVKQYVSDYAREVETHFKFETMVTGLKKTGDKWLVDSKYVGPHAKANVQPEMETFDYVIVCTGHYSHPFIPDVPGLREYAKTHQVLAAKYFDNPDSYVGKTVLVVGNSSSGIDIANQAAKTAKKVVVSARSASNAPTKGNIETVGVITQYSDAGIDVEGAPGDAEAHPKTLTDVDVVIYCTGYLYSFPFLHSYVHHNDNDLISNGVRIQNLYRQLFYIHDPSIAFICMPKNVVPFPLAETQGATVARVWSGRLKLPSKDEQLASLRKEEEERGTGSAHHTLKHPLDAQYQQALTDWIKNDTHPDPDKGFFGVEWDEERYNWRRNVKKPQLGDLSL
ncbi:Thiol-specific monooxygenase [Yarrowia sp. B02]|nr:Thiol-specific monooxygenase [Yarrowia sp. B02]